MGQGRCWSLRLRIRAAELMEAGHGPRQVANTLHMLESSTKKQFAKILGSTCCLFSCAPSHCHRNDVSLPDPSSRQWHFDGFSWSHAASPTSVKINKHERLNMTGDFIVPSLGVELGPGWVLIMDSAPSLKAKKALEWFKTTLQETQETSNDPETQHENGHSSPPKRHPHAALT